MPLRLGVPLVLLGLAVLTAVSYLVNLDLYWPVALVAGALAAQDSARLQAKRYDSAFPLEPPGTFLAVTLALPLALPWYLRLRHRIQTGQLRVRTAPRSYVPGIVLLTAILLLAGWLTLRPPRFMRELGEVQAALQSRIARPFTLTLSGNSATVQFSNVMVGDSADARAALARKAAEVVREYFRHRRTLTSLTVSFGRVTKRGMVTTTAAEDGFTWTSGQLLEDRLPEAAVRSTLSRR